MTRDEELQKEARRLQDTITSTAKVCVNNPGYAAYLGYFPERSVSFLPGASRYDQVEDPLVGYLKAVAAKVAPDWDWEVIELVGNEPKIIMKQYRGHSE